MEVDRDVAGSATSVAGDAGRTVVRVGIAVVIETGRDVVGEAGMDGGKRAEGEMRNAGFTLSRHLRAESGRTLYDGGQSVEPFKYRPFIMRAEMKAGKSRDVPVNFAVRIVQFLLVASEALGMQRTMPRDDGLKLFLGNVASEGDG